MVRDVADRDVAPGLEAGRTTDRRRDGRMRAAATRLVSGSFAAVLVLWLACGASLAQFSGRVTDWFVMTDELLYERLALSIARTGSPLPVLHERTVSSIDQLYPILLAVFFRHGSVHSDLVRAHVFGAFLMTSACIPAYLLARGTLGRRWLALVAALLTVSVPWMLYSGFLLTEVAAYPAFLWALWGAQRSVARPSPANDAAALIGLVVAFLARTQFIVLVLVPPLSLVVFELVRNRRLPAVRNHLVLAGAYTALAVACGVLALQGEIGSVLGAYGTSVNGSVLPADTSRSLVQHLATLALGLGIVPVVVGAGWLIGSVPRRRLSPDQHAFACVSLVAVLVVTFEVTVFDLRLGVGLAVYDRYLFYLAPAFIIATLCAVSGGSLPVWSLAVSGAVVAAGFAVDDLPRFQWSQFPQLDPDAPVAGLYRPLVHLAGSLGALRGALALLTLLVAGMYLVGTRVLRPALLTGVVVGLMLTTITLATWYDVHRLTTSGDWADRPLTGSANGTSELGWVDGRVGAGGQVTEVPYHVSSDFLVDLRFWRDLEFWNRSVLRDAEYPSTASYAYTGGTFPKMRLAFDPVSGRSRIFPTRWVVQSVTESRFQIAGPVVEVNDGAMLIDADKPWHLAWATTGPYDDGWMKPDVPAVIRVYPSEGQIRPRVHFLSLQIWPPSSVARRSFTVRSNEAVRRYAVMRGATAYVNAFPVCVPAKGYAPVVIEAPGSSSIPGDLGGTYRDSLGERRGSIYLADTSVSDDLGKECTVEPKS